MYINHTFIQNHRWRFDAICAQVDSAIFHSDGRVQQQQAISVCTLCPVKKECLDSAISDHDWWWGIRAGMYPEQRREYAKKVLGMVVTDYTFDETINVFAGLVEKQSVE